jgi:hypothetical protein
VAKLSISKAWDETREVFGRDGKLLTTVALALLVLPGVVQSLAAPVMTPGELPKPGPWMIIALIAILIGLVGQLAVIRLATGPETTVGEAIAHGARRFLIYLAAMILLMLPFIVLMFGLGVSVRASSPSPGLSLAILFLTGLFLYVIVRFIIASAVTSAEAVGPIGVLQRSWVLTRGNWWRLFGFVVLFIVAVLLLMAATGAVVGIVVGILFGAPEPMSVGALIIALVTQLAVTAITVVFLVMVARIYLQLVRHNAEATVPSTGD